MSLFLRIEDQKRELLEELGGWKPERLRFQPGANEWSALQMVDHIMRTEREILLVVYSNEGSNHSVGIVDRLRTRFVHSVFRSKRRVKVPSSARIVLPGSVTDLDVLAKQWNEVRATLAQNIERLVAQPPGRGIFRHPVGGWMDMQTVLEFFSVHMLHHGFQLERLHAASDRLK